MPAQNRRSAEPYSAIHSPTPDDAGETVPLPVDTLAARIALRHGLTLAAAEARIFRQALYPAARWLGFLLRLRQRYFEPDWRFIRGVGRATTMAQFQVEVQHYSDDKAHHGFLRGTLKLRVSVRRLRALARDVLPAATAVEAGAPRGLAADSVPPAAAPAKSSRPAPEFRVISSRWQGPERRQAPSRPLPPRKALAPATDETVRRLEAEVAQLKEQREILKRAVGIIAQSHQPPDPGR